MSAIAKSIPNPPGGRDEWLRVVAVGFFALLLLAAAADRRNAIVDTTTGPSKTVERSNPVPTNAEMMREMLTHD